MGQLNDHISYGEPIYITDGKKKKYIIDETEHFVNFPGFEHGNWERLITVGFDRNSPRIRFRTEIYQTETGYYCIWELQPDGFYYADSDGFGAEKDSELVLRAELDANGDFITPFRIYSIDGKMQPGADPD